MKNHALTFLRTLSNIPKPNRRLIRRWPSGRGLLDTRATPLSSRINLVLRFRRAGSDQTIAASLPLRPLSRPVRETRAPRIFVHKLYVSFLPSRFLDIFRVSSRATVVITTSVSLLRFLSFPFFFYTQLVDNFHRLDPESRDSLD